MTSRQNILDQWKHATSWRAGQVGAGGMTEIARPVLLDVDVEGGRLRVARWGSGSPSSGTFAVVAAHGITASHVSWGIVATRLQDEITVVVPDLRGRGGSSGLPGPYGMAAHARDLITVADALGIEKAIVAGHSMGGFVATTLAVADPSRVQAVLLVEGGIPAGTPAGDIDPDQAAELVLGPALQRLRVTFESREAYRDFWKRHPALVGHWSSAIQDYVDYDLEAVAGGYRSKVVEEAVRADYRDIVSNPAVLGAAGNVRCPMGFLYSPRGLRNEPPGQYPPESVRAATERIPSLRVEGVADCNHYTILITDAGAARIADSIRGMVSTLSGP